jgi:hypothetical protein
MFYAIHQWSSELAHSMPVERRAGPFSVIVEINYDNISLADLNAGTRQFKVDRQIAATYPIRENT